MPYSKVGFHCKYIMIQSITACITQSYLAGLMLYGSPRNFSGRKVYDTNIANLFAFQNNHITLLRNIGDDKQQ